MADADRALSEVLDRFGLDSLTSQPNLFRNTLRDKLPNHPREAALLVTALEAGVPARLRTESHISDVDTLSAQLAGGLERSYGLSPESARWAVQTWANTMGLTGSAEPLLASPSAEATNSLDAATVLRTPSGEVTAPPTSTTEVSAQPVPAGGVTAQPTPTSEGTAPPMTPSEATVLRAPLQTQAPDAQRAEAETGLPPTGTTAKPPKPGGGWSRRRLVVPVLGAVVVIAIIVAVAVIVRGSHGGSHPAAGHSTASGTSANRSASSSASTGSSSASTGSASTTRFASISPELAHRGDHEGYPEETLPSFVQAAQRGFTIETDVRWTKDGVPILNHDVNTGLGMVCSGGPYAVAKTSWAVLHSRCRTSPSASKTHRSYGIPTFDATVEQLAKIPGATLFAELKVDQTPAQNREYLAILKKWHMVPRTVVTSFYSQYLVDFGKEATQEGVTIRTLRFAGAGAPTTLTDLQRTHVWGAIFIEEWGSIPGLMSSARKAGIHVGIGTSPGSGDGPALWSEAKKLKADFVLTDHPSTYRTWLAQH
jgi:glycerophosphoryl diester phosphodiesterase